MDRIDIIKVTPKELDQLQKIGKLTFFETFAAGNTENNLQMYLKEGFSKEKLGVELSNKNSEFYFAQFDQTVIGYLKVNFGKAQTELNDQPSVEIERIYVLKSYIGKGIGKLLFNKAVHIAKGKKAHFIWLGVWENNTNAISFYQKNGFVEFDRHIFRVGNEDQIDIMMKLLLH